MTTYRISNGQPRSTPLLQGAALVGAGLGLATGFPQGRSGSGNWAYFGVAALLTAGAWQLVRATRTDYSSSSWGAPDLYIERTLIVNKAPHECYEFWRDCGNLPQFIAHVQSVTFDGASRSHWAVSLPNGRTLEWDAVLTVDEPGKRLTWRTESEEALCHVSSVRFQRAPGERGTLVTWMLHYQAPGGRLGATLAQLIGPDPFGQVRDNLRRFKQLIETGEIATTTGQPSGARSLLGRLLPEGRKSRQPGFVPPSTRRGYQPVSAAQS